MLTVRWAGTFDGRPEELLSFAKALTTDVQQRGDLLDSPFDFTALSLDYGDVVTIDVVTNEVDVRCVMRLKAARHGTRVIADMRFRFKGSLRVLNLVPGFLVRSFASRAMSRDLDRLPAAFDDWRAGRPIPDMLRTGRTAAPARAPVLPTKPGYWMDWSAATVDVNRAGRMTPRQRRRVKGSIAGHAASALVAIPALAGIVALPFQFIPVIAIGCAAFVFVAGEWTQVRCLVRLARDLARATCESAQGIAKVTATRNSIYGTTASVRIAGVSSSRSKVAKTFEDGATYRVFYLPLTKYFVNAVPAAQTDQAGIEAVSLSWEIRSPDGSRRAGRWPTT